MTKNQAGTADQAVNQIAQAFANSIRISVPMPKADPVRASLARLTMDAKRAGDWDTAIRCLQRLKTEYNETGTRLPSFLMQAGRVEEGKREFFWLIETAASRYERFPDGRPMRDRDARCWIAFELAEIYDSMRVAFKRLKRTEEAAMYAQRSTEQLAVAQKLRAEMDVPEGTAQ